MVIRTATSEPPEATRTTVLIAGDHPIYRSGLRILLDEVESFHVVGESGTGSDVVAMAHTLRPQVVVMDIVQPGQSIAEVISPITGCCPDTAVLIISSLDDREALLSAMHAGARGYLLNGARWQDLVLAVEMVRAGGLVFDSYASEWVLENLSRTLSSGARRSEPEPCRCDMLKLVRYDGSAGSAGTRLPGVRRTPTRVGARPITRL
ncbi:DNA-binding response regulator [Streptomyces pluripotens]|uniref:DNA-binding response regulator n=1 Tax=Streptomyces pluripotens TaxID=1355015 RepID=A0A221P5Q3_9ACTN|nr:MULTISPECIES: response regulator transcription factor [Streptomyces]ARP72875.1 response regulator [Streptomyces pluripotens]ASN27125.1 DNA-binding response regulator [Streptomyces pluripotens]MCH0559869.1 response regulator transcription factor [Streptomyces sp. MUM 16J]